VQVLLDACVALNLEATGEFDAIARALGMTFAMATRAAEEALFLVDAIDGKITRTPIDLDLHVQKGTLEIIQLNPNEETATFVDLASRVDDGEAQSLSLAHHRGLPIATDDRLAIRVSWELGVAEPVATTTLLKQYSNRAGLSPEKITSTLISVERRASFRPPRGSSDLSWWLSHTATHD
jgi:predicted nucleic acid-binding protein